MALVAAGGRPSVAEQHCDTSATTLKAWKVRHADRYYELAEKYRPELEKRIVSDLLESHTLASAVETAGLEKMREGIDDGSLSGKELAGAVRSATIAKGVSADKVLAFSGRPVNPQPDRDPGEILQSLARKGIRITLDSPGREQPIDAEVVE